MKKKDPERDEDLKEDCGERRCFQCGDSGHVRRDCPAKPRPPAANANANASADAERAGRGRSHQEKPEAPPPPAPVPVPAPPPPLSLLGFPAPFPLGPAPSWPLNDPSIIFAQPAAGGRGFRMPRPPGAGFPPGKSFLAPGPAVPLLPHVRINFIQHKK